MSKKNDDFIYHGNFGTLIDFTDKQERVNYYSKNMLLKTNSMFKYDNLPETIPEKMLELGLQINGYVVITKVNKNEITRNIERYNEGIYMFSTGVTLGGEPDYLYRPTIAIIVNPSMGLSIQRTIGIDCVVIRNDTLLMGLRPVNSHYASMLVENDITLRMYDINSRISSLISASDDTVAESARRYIKDIENGKMGIISDSQLIDSLKTQPYQGTTDKLVSLIEYEQYIRGVWFNEIGLQSNFNMKRESLNSSETGVNESAIVPLIDTMLKCREEDFKLCNELFNTNIVVKLSSSWEDIQQEIEEDIITPNGPQDITEGGVMNEIE